MYRIVLKAISSAFVSGISVLAASNALCQQVEVSPAPVLIGNQPTIGPDSVPSPRAQEPAQPGAITIAQLEQMAENHNPTLAQAARRVEAAQGQQVQVGLYPNPVIGYQAEEMGENGRAGQHGMFFRQEVVTANKLGLNQAVLSHEVQLQRYDLQPSGRCTADGFQPQPG